MRGESRRVVVDPFGTTVKPGPGAVECDQWADREPGQVGAVGGAD